MRTDGDGQRRDPPPDARGTPVSRRAFLAASGVLVGPSVGGVVGASSSREDDAVLVEATAPYVRSARTLASAVERSDRSATVRVTRAERASPAAFRDGPADVQLAGRPVTESARETEASSSLVGAVGVGGWAALAHPDGEWREPLRRGDVRTHWADDEVPVEAWSETDWQSIPADAAAAGVAPADDAIVFVRGRRPAQYSRGFGGVGYYRVDLATLDPVVRRRDATPVVRLEYVNVAADARDRDAVEALLQTYDERTADVRDAETAFLDPAIERTH